MSLGSLAIYYNEDKGFIIAPYTKMKGSIIQTPINPVQLFAKDISSSELGEIIIDSLSKSQNAKEVSRDEMKKYSFWQASGIKGFNTFSKKYLSISITEEKEYICIIKMFRENTGGYSPTEERLHLPLNSSAKDIGVKVFQLLGENRINDLDNILSFKTSHGNIVSYIALPYCFIDIGDGHTDAYQIYEFEDSDKTYIGFFIDSGYDSFTEMSIKNKWQGWYRDLFDFRFEVVNKDRIKISAKTENRIIKSYLIREEDRFVEVKYEIEFIDKKSEVESAFEKLISSIKITLKL